MPISQCDSVRLTKTVNCYDVAGTKLLLRSVQYPILVYFINFVLNYSMYVCIYYAFVHPYLMYGIEIYANTYITYLDKLVKINNN